MRITFSLLLLLLMAFSALANSNSKGLHPSTTTIISIVIGYATTALGRWPPLSGCKCEWDCELVASYEEKLKTCPKRVNRDLEKCRSRPTPSKCSSYAQMMKKCQQRWLRLHLRNRVPCKPNRGRGTRYFP